MIPVSILKHSHKSYRDHETPAGSVGRERERCTGPAGTVTVGGAPACPARTVPGRDRDRARRARPGPCPAVTVTGVPGPDRDRPGP
jgi:hypothetical protein